jgi:asparagine synthase (glutamine-hydrolysing)
MSGVGALWRRDGSPLAPGELDALALSLRRRGPSGHDRAISDGVGILHMHCWTTPEEIGERQPLATADGLVSLAFDGRLDNRGELTRELASGEPNISDATLLLRAYEAWGERCFARLLGPFAVCLFDRRTRHLLLARDPLGDRTLYYHLTDRLVVIASEVAGVLAHGGVPRRLDETTLALFLAVEAPARGATFFSDVHEVPPGHILAVTPGTTELRAFWTPSSDPPPRLRSDREYAEAFRELLREAVRCRMRSSTPIGVLMSGGLDSTSAACLAAEELARGGRRTGSLPVFSWVFDELPCDERCFMDAVVSRYGLDAHRIPGDQLWPLRDAAEWEHDAGRPAQSIYRLLHESAWKQARILGVNVLLTGNFGDPLWCGAERSLIELVNERRVTPALGSLIACLARRGPSGLRRDPGLRGLVAQIGHLSPTDRRRRAPRAGKPWLTAEAVEMLAVNEPGGPTPASEAGRRFSQLATPLAAAAAPFTVSQPNRFGLEARNPFRDRRLVEFMAGIPCHLVYRGGLYKHLLREAMKGILPDRVRLRVRPTSYLPLYNRGFFERERATVRSLLDDPGAWWPRLVRRDWLAAATRTPLRPNDDGATAVVPWFCVVIELWRRGFSPGEQPILRAT